jgi:hypothetical protein
MGDRVVTLGDPVEGDVHTGTHDLLDLLHAAPELALEGVALIDARRAHRGRPDSLRSAYPPKPKGPRDATAS